MMKSSDQASQFPLLTINREEAMHGKGFMQGPHRMHATMTACRDIYCTLRLQTLPPRHHPWDFIADYEEGTAVSSLPSLDIRQIVS